MSQTTDIDPQQLLEMDPEQAVRQHADLFLDVAERKRQQGKDDVADIIERTVEQYQGVST